MTLLKYRFCRFQTSCALAIFLLRAAPTWSADAPQSADQQTALLIQHEAQLLASANKGGAEEAIELGYFYLADNISRATNAVPWFRKAAELGDVRAQVKLAWMYREGVGVHVDWDESLKLSRKAADSGHPHAEFELGDLYSTGFGEPRSTNDTCLRLFERAATRGSIDAKFALARRYQYGAGYERDYWQAVSRFFGEPIDQAYIINLGFKPWFDRVADNGLPPEEPFGRFVVHYLRATHLGNPTSQNQLGEYIRDGWNTRANPPLAMQFFEAAARKGNQFAEMNLGQAYEQGAGVPKDARQALSWYGRAAEKGLKAAVIAKARLEKELSNQPAGPLPVPP